MDTATIDIPAVRAPAIRMRCGMRIALLATVAWYGSILPIAAHAQGYDISSGEEITDTQPAAANRSSSLRLPTKTGQLPSLNPITTPPYAVTPSKDFDRPMPGFSAAPAPNTPQRYSPPAAELAMPAKPFYPGRGAPASGLPAIQASPTTGQPASPALPSFTQTAPAPLHSSSQPTTAQGSVAPALPLSSPPSAETTHATMAATNGLPALPPPPSPLPTQAALPVAAEVQAPPAVLGQNAIPVPPAQQPAGQLPALSAQSKQILGSIHPPAAKPERRGKVDMKRVNPEVAQIVEKAEQSYESAGIKISVSRSRMDATSELERAYNALMGGDTDVAISIYQDVLRSEPTNEDALFGLAATYHRIGQTDNARPLYGRLLKQNPAHREALNNFLILVSSEAPQEALNELSTLEQRYPAFSPIPAQMAIIYEKLGQPEVALSKAQRAIELAPENWVYKYNLAIMLDRQGQYAAAAGIYKLLIQAALQGEKLPMDLSALQARYNYISARLA